MNEMNLECVILSLIDEADAGYGILINLPSGACRELHSVCLHRCDAERICDVVNRLGVSECHICDVIEDLMP